MNLEAERLIAKAKQVRNVAADGQIVQKATRYMTQGEKEAKEEERRRIQDTLSPANAVGATALTQEGRRRLAAYSNYLKRDLTENTAPEVTDGETRNALLAEERRLAEEIKEGMLPHEVMRRNPVGAVGQHMKWEKLNKEKILAWKNLRRINNPGDPDEDMANVEQLRPSMARPDGAATFMGDAQIPGVFAMTPKAKENWPLGEPKIDTALAQAERRELEELRARLAASEQEKKSKAKTKREPSEKQKAHWAALGQAARERAAAKNASPAEVQPQGE